MRQQTFEQYLEERHAAQYHRADDDMEEEFNRWFENLGSQQLLEYAERWGKESSSIYLINTLTHLIKNHDVR